LVKKTSTTLISRGAIQKPPYPNSGENKTNLLDFAPNPGGFRGLIFILIINAVEQ
jgi:hypothetical protein